MEFRTADCIRRSTANPVLSAKDIPFDASLIFNAGVAKYCNRYVMVFRNDYGSGEAGWRRFHYDGDQSADWQLKTNIGLAFSDDGVKWEVQSKPCFTLEDDDILRAYDPRLTVIDGRVYMCFAADTRHGIRGGVAVTEDFDKFEILSLSAPDNRNMVLFPDRIGGKFVRLERPFPVYGRGGGEKFDVWMARSSDLRYWGDNSLLLGAENVPFANTKIGPAAPPVRTPRGYLTTFHAINQCEKELYSWHRNWHKRYWAGLMLLDLEDPSRIIGMGKEPLIVPETDYEMRGFRGEVIFPGGMLLEDSGEVKIYYGASDTVECLATADVNDLIDFCLR